MTAPEELLEGSSDRASARPKPGPPRPYHFPRFEREVLSNGITVVVAPVRTFPLTSVTIVVDAGAMTEPAGRDGVAALTARGLLEGTGRRSGEELVAEFEQLGATVESDADWDAATLTTTVLSARTERALGLLAEVLLDPGFPEHEIERLKSERLAEILQLRAEPRGLADEMYSAVLYAPESRYRRPEAGSADSVAGLSRDTVREFHHSRYRPGTTTVVIAGDVDASDAIALVGRLLGSWKASPTVAAHVDDQPAQLTRGVYVVDKGGAPQSELRIGHVGLPRTTPDFFPVLVMNAVLGGLFSSRINLNLREVHGYTYGAGSTFDWRRGAGPFVVSTAVRSDVTAAAAREVMQEIERIRSEPISPEELSLATSYLAGVFPIRYETTSAVANALAAAHTYGLPAGYFDSYRERVRAVSVEDVSRAAESHLHPSAIQLLAVGDASAIREPLEALDLGSVLSYGGPEGS